MHKRVGEHIRALRQNNLEYAMTKQRDVLKSLLENGEITAEIRELAERVTRKRDGNGTIERWILGLRVLNTVEERNRAQRRWGTYRGRCFSRGC